MREASEDGQAPAAIGAGTAAAHAQQVLGVRLKALRLARRLSLRDLAEATGTSASFISQLERGLTGASTASLNQMASALGVSVAMLFEESATQNHGVLRRSERPSLPPSNGCRKMLL
ncbi:MAG: helix-turn-helix domain-containing protein, partial [Mesorhizobium sp.]